MSNIASTLVVFGEVGSEDPVERMESALARVLCIDFGVATTKSAIVFVVVTIDLTVFCNFSPHLTCFYV